MPLLPIIYWRKNAHVLNLPGKKSIRTSKNLAILVEEFQIQDENQVVFGKRYFDIF